MKACFIQIWKLHGINTVSPDIKDNLLGKADNPKVVARMTDDPGPYCLHIDRHTAVTHSFPIQILPDQQFGLCDADLAIHVEKAKSIRELAWGEGAFVVFEGDTDVLVPEFSARWDAESYTGCMDDVGKVEVTKQFRPFVLAVLGALGLDLAKNASRNATKIGEVTFLLDEGSEKPIYAIEPYLFSNVNITVSSPFTHEIFKQVAEYVPKILKHNELSTSFKLLATSFDKSNDELESFIFAWSALESFIKASSRETYSKQSSMSSETRKPETSKQIRLPVAFAKLVKILDQNRSDVEHFKSLNCTRNNLFHEAKIPETVPTEAVQRLLIKYLKLHLNLVK